MADPIDVHVHVFVHDETIGGVNRRLDTILTQLRALGVQGDRLLMASKDMLDTLDKIDTSTNAIADEITALKNKVATGMSQADVDAVQARLDAAAAKLQGIAADPDNPVPQQP